MRLMFKHTLNKEAFVVTFSGPIWYYYAMRIHLKTSWIILILETFKEHAFDENTTEK